MDGTLDSPADPEATPDTDSPGEPRLVTVAEAAKRTGLSRKAITGRLDRGTLRAARDSAGWRMIPVAELDRAGLLEQSHPAESRVESREIVQWQALYERERERAERTEADRAAIAAVERQLREELLVLANAGPIRAMRLRRETRRRLATQHEAATAAISATDPLPAPIAEA